MIIFHAALSHSSCSSQAVMRSTVAYRAETSMAVNLAVCVWYGTLQKREVVVHFRGAPRMRCLPNPSGHESRRASFLRSLTGFATAVKYHLYFCFIWPEEHGPYQAISWIKLNHSSTYCGLTYWTTLSRARIRRYGLCLPLSG